MTNSMYRMYAEKKTRGYFSGARREIAPLLPPSPFRVFEVGCGEGATLSWLKEAGRVSWAAGVDISETAIACALENVNIDHVAVANVETAVELWPKGSVDVLLILDVLEHLSDPWTALQRFSNELTDQSFIIISLPNVRSIRVLLPLVLAGRWTYRDSGILDKTHLRFFTRSSAIQLVESAGLRVEKLLGLRDNHWLLNLCNSLSLGIFSDFLVPQFLIRAKRR
jgi:2-polyprenyl-3-methyl-5-hydroxy-6-metoxy-1,4-benzoquinol methylase